MGKKLMVTVVLAATMIGGGTGAALAGHGPDSGFEGPPPGMERGPRGFDERMAKVVKLTDDQQTLIKSLFDAEREQSAVIFDKMRENRTLLIQAAEATTFDEAAVRAIAVAQAKIETELIVSRTKLQNQIYTLLTADQREILKLLRPEMKPLPPKGGE